MQLERDFTEFNKRRALLLKGNLASISKQGCSRRLPGIIDSSCIALMAGQLILLPEKFVKG
eukprot:2558985-Pleurochrysis_carterae.AAC.1